jgi:hypothetical protein
MKAWHFLHVSSAIIGKHRFLDKASIQPQQTSDYHKYCSTGNVCWRGVTGESNANKKHPNANQCLQNLSDKAFVDKARLIGRNGGFRRAQC